MFPDPSNKLLKNYLSQYGITERHQMIDPDNEQKYVFRYDYDLDIENCFTEDEIKEILKEPKKYLNKKICACEK
jgi:hypothetical protein